MSIHLEEYREFLEAQDPHMHDTLEASFQEATRVMSPTGLKNFLEGGKALAQLSRGEDVLISYFQEMPAAVKEVGDELIQDAVEAALKLSSMVSGQVIALIFSTLPTAARRLADPDLMRQYFSLLHKLSARAPRGMRPMLEHLDELLSQLTLGGLRRWAMWGAQAHGSDFKAMAAYFALESPDSQKVLQNERRGTLFVDTQRKLNFYLRALWGRSFFLRPTSGDYETREGLRPYIEDRMIHVPDAYDDVNGVTGTNVYRAAVAHAASHMTYTRAPISAEQLNPGQMALIGYFEDARVEYKAIREFPGLQKLWRPFFDIARERAAESERADNDIRTVLEDMALALMDPRHEPMMTVTADLAKEFWERIEAEQDEGQLSWDLGVTLYNRLGSAQPLPPAHVLEDHGLIYRDDNRYVWEFEEIDWDADAEVLPGSEKQVHRKPNVMEMVNEIDVELAGDDAQEIWTLETEFYRDGDPVGMSMNELEGKEPVSEPYHYKEWDYKVQLHRPDWVTVLEKRQPIGDEETIDDILAQYKPIASRLKHVVDMLAPQGLVVERHVEDGDQLDLNAAVRAMVDLRMGETPDPRVNMRYTRKQRDLAVVVLLDLSESTNETVAGTDSTVLSLTREATTLLSWAIDGIGDPFAVHGFASDGRHDVQYYRFKDFDQPFSDEAKARMAGMQGGLSTRMGGALRHAGHYLSRRPEQRKLVLLVTDGEPSDIDEKDPQYLRHDTKKAVEELAGNGITSYCLTLDPHADQYVSRIFGANHYTVVDNVTKLPEKLPQLFVGLTS